MPSEQSVLINCKNYPLRLQELTDKTAVFWLPEMAGQEDIPGYKPTRATPPPQAK